MPYFFLQLIYPDWFSPVVEAGNLSELAVALFNVFLVVAGAAAFLMMVVGGFHYITSMGSPAKLTDAKDRIFNALLGLLLLFASYTVLNYIGPELVQLKEPGLSAKITEPQITSIVSLSPSQTEGTLDTSPFGKHLNTTIAILQGKNKTVLELMREFAQKSEERDAGKFCLGGGLVAAEIVDMGRVCEYGYEICANKCESATVCSTETITRTELGEGGWESALNSFFGSFFSGNDLENSVTNALNSITQETSQTIVQSPCSYEECCIPWIELPVEGASVFKTQSVACNGGVLRNEKSCNQLNGEQKEIVVNSSINEVRIAADYLEGTKGLQNLTEVLNGITWINNVVGDLDYGTKNALSAAEAEVRSKLENFDQNSSLGRRLSYLREAKNGIWEKLGGVKSAISEKKSGLLYEISGLTSQISDLSGAEKENAEEAKIEKEAEKDFFDKVGSGLNRLTVTVGDIAAPSERKIQTVFEKARVEVENCVDRREETVFIPCEIAREMFEFGPDEEPLIYNWIDVATCVEAYHTFCVWTKDKDDDVEIWASRIELPIELLKDAYESILRLWDATSFCACDNVNFYTSPLAPVPSDARNFNCQNSCECVDPPCPDQGGGTCTNNCSTPSADSDAPFPDKFGNLKESAFQIACGSALSTNIDSLHLAYWTLNRDLDKVDSWKEVDEQSIYACEDIKDMLELYRKDGSCPDPDVFPCCPPKKLVENPITQTMERIDITSEIENCDALDYFYCNKPGTSIAYTPPEIPECTAEGISALPSSAEVVDLTPEPSETQIITNQPWCDPASRSQTKISDCPNDGNIKNSRQWDDASQNLKAVINCFYGNYQGNPVPITSISDSNLSGRAGSNDCQIRDCKCIDPTDLTGQKCPIGDAGTNCNQTLACQHKFDSHHYGEGCPVRSIGFSYEFDLDMDPNDTAKAQMIRNALADCLPTIAEGRASDSSDFHIRLQDISACPL